LRARPGSREPRPRARIALRPDHQHADPPHLLGLLRVRGERPKGSRTSNNFDEIAASHCLPLKRLRTTLTMMQLQQGFATGEMGSGSKLHSSNLESRMSH
jgi:hypothetical protein